MLSKDPCLNISLCMYEQNFSISDVNSINIQNLSINPNITVISRCRIESWINDMCNLISNNIEELIRAYLIILSNFEFEIDCLSFDWRISSTKRSLKLIKGTSIFGYNHQTSLVNLKIVSCVIGGNSEKKFRKIIFIDVDGHNSYFSL